MNPKDIQGVRDGNSGMTTLEVTLTLPDQLAQAARQAGLLTGGSLERLIEQALQRQAGQQLLDAMQRLRDANTPPLTEDDVAAAVAAVRKSRGEAGR